MILEFCDLSEPTRSKPRASGDDPKIAAINFIVSA